MIWIFLIAFLIFLLLVTYGLGFFIPHVTNTAYIGFSRSVEELFALTLQPQLASKWIPGYKSIEFENGTITDKGSVGKIKIHSDSLPIEIVNFIPNYRWAFITSYQGISAHVQFTFYKKGKTESRIVLIIKTTTNSNIKRTQMALRKKGVEHQMLQVLIDLKKEIESCEAPEHIFPNTNADENPNLTL